VALSKELHRTSDADAGMDAMLLQDRVPLVAVGFQFIPSGANQFKKTDVAAVYAEIYEPGLLGEKPPQVAVQLKVTDRKTGQSKQDSGLVNVANMIKAGRGVINVGLKLPVETLTPGAYRVELTAIDSAGKSAARTADFDIL